ncbi:MAG: sensor histidine kinase [Chitinophagaceae bacterium]|nr:sensor histidine kinase [Chitinophagaceae bacterium]
MKEKEKIRKLPSENATRHSDKQQCSLLIDQAMELRHSDPAAALTVAAKALALSEAIHFVLGKARSNFCMGLVHFNLSDYERAFIFLHRAHLFFQQAGDRWGISNAINNIGLIHFRLGDYTKALDHFSASLQIKRESHDRFGTSNVLLSMAAIHREAGNTTDAQQLLMESLKISEALKADTLTSKGLMELGILLLIEEKFSEAAEKFSEARLLFEQQHNPGGIAQCFLYLGKTESASGKPESAISFFQEGQIIARDAGDKSLSTVFLVSIAMEKLKSGESLESIALLLDARALAERTLEKPVQSVIAQQLSAGYEAAGNLKEALKEYKKFILLKEEINAADTLTTAHNHQVSVKVETLERENKILEIEKLAALNELTAQLKTQEVNTLNAMMEGQEKERSRIAADLHDRVGSALSAIKLHMDGIRLSADIISQKQSSFEKVISMLDDAVNEVRQVSHDLASGVLVKFGLVDAIHDLCNTIQSAGGVEVNFITAGLDSRLDHKIEIALYRSVQELISNILKYAGAKEITIYFHRQEEWLSLMVEDDGIGFDPEKKSSGTGISNVRSRINLLNGITLFDTSPGRGCTVTIKIPISVLL